MVVAPIFESMCSVIVMWLSCNKEIKFIELQKTSLSGELLLKPHNSFCLHDFKGPVNSFHTLSVSGSKSCLKLLVKSIVVCCVFILCVHFPAGMPKWLAHSTLVQRALGSKPPSELSQRIYQLSVILDKRAKGIRRCGHIKRKDQGHAASLVYLFSGIFVLCT